ncbi:MAG TPA: peptidylprolyl isomerase, partial [Pirellulales bacterium]|nr:peptidylprolyl isomerase [Pirellulales bacterium]
RQFDNIPQAPTQPMPVRQPVNWAGGPGPQERPDANSTRPFTPPAGSPPAQRLDNALIIARVGADVVLASDLVGQYGNYLAAQAQGAPESVLAPARKELQDQIRNIADIKILFAEATKTIPPEALKDIEKKITDEFDNAKLKEMMKRAQCNTKEEIEAKLREVGTSVERRRKAFYEQSVAMIWLQQQIKEEEITYGEIFAYYQNNGTKFDHEAQSRWEELTVLFNQFSSRDEAKAAIVKLGNEVLNGKPFAEVAKAGSQGPTAARGGLRDWTTKGSLKSAILDEVIFTLEVMRMSQIFADADGFHIVRVIERKEAYRTPFTDAQVDIRKQLKAEQIEKKRAAYLAKVRMQNPIWTIFDSQGPDGVASGK